VTRPDLFHTLPGLWQEGDAYDILWAQVRRQLEKGGGLNESERLVLIELLQRVASRPAARKALGIRPKARTAARNERIADMYIKLRDYDGKARKDAEAEVHSAFPKVREAALRAVIDSNVWLAPARGRQLAAYLLKNNLGSTPIILKETRKKRSP
jgi:hypothetical protein